jgi:hypothetical protein
MSNLKKFERKLQQELSITVWKVVWWDKIGKLLFQEEGIKEQSNMLEVFWGPYERG